MSWRALAAALAVVLGAWMTFDGVHAFVRGDYVTPRSGEHAGELGPWARAVSAVGVDPRSTLIRAVHVALGIAWLVAAAGVLTRAAWASPATVACAVASLWYLPSGTLIGAVELLLLATVSALRDSGLP